MVQAVPKARAKINFFSKKKKIPKKKIFFLHIYSSYAKILGETNFHEAEGVERKKGKENTPGTAGGPGGRDQTLAIKSRKNVRKITFFS